MSSRIPLVSVIITSYNRAHWVGQSIQSALDQDYPNLEIIISDNASTDNSDQVIKSYCHDKRIKYYRNVTNVGALLNFKKCVTELAKGEYVTFVSNDDYLIDNQFISKGITLTEKYDNVGLVYGKYIISSVDKNIIYPVESSQNYYGKEFYKGIDMFFEFGAHPYFGFGGCMLKLSGFKSLGEVIYDYFYIDTISPQLIMLESNVCFINNDVYVVREHSTNASNASNQKMLGKFYIDNRFKMTERILMIFTEKYKDEYSKQLNCWRNTVLLRDAKNTLLYTNVKDKQGFKLLSAYIKNKFPEIYNKLNFQDFNYMVRIYFILPMLRIDFLRKMLSFVFPNKGLFKNKLG